MDRRYIPKKSGAFSFTPTNALKAQALLKKYPEGKAASALVPLLELAQEQNGGWLSPSVIEYVASYVEVAPIRALEAASFYDTFHMTPPARYEVKICTTPPCALRGSNDLLKVAKKWLGVDVGGGTHDGKFSLKEVECLGHCTCAPIVTIHKEIYENVTEEDLCALLEACSEDHLPLAEAFLKEKRNK